jgi:fatty-acyl-CoA synthase
LPFQHCFGMVMANLGCTTHGACMVIAEPGLPDFASYDLTSLRTGVMAGSPCPIEVMKRCVSDMHMAEVATHPDIADVQVIGVPDAVR